MATSLIDLYTSLNPNHGSFIGNRSIVIHSADGTRLACANFEEVAPEEPVDVTPTTAIDDEEPEETPAPVESSPAEEEPTAAPEPTTAPEEPEDDECEAEEPEPEPEPEVPAETTAAEEAPATTAAPEEEVPAPTAEAPNVEP